LNLLIDTIPDLTYFIIILGILVSIGSGYSRKRFSNVEETKRMSKEVSSYNKELRSAIMNKDKVKEAKLKKKEPQMKQMQAKLARDSLKPTLIFLAPLMFVWILLLPRIIGNDWFTIPAASSPISMNILLFSTAAVELSNGTIIPNAVPTFFWYLIASIAFQGIIMKLLKLT